MFFIDAVTGFVVCISITAMFSACISRYKRLNETRARHQRLDAILNQVFGGMGNVVAMAKEDLKTCGEMYAAFAYKQFASTPGADNIMAVAVDSRDPGPHFEHWSNTTFGNYAYVATASGVRDEEARRRARELVNGFLEWYQMRLTKASG